MVSDSFPKPPAVFDMSSTADAISQADHTLQNTIVVQDPGSLVSAACMPAVRSLLSELEESRKRVENLLSELPSDSTIQGLEIIAD